jgi:protein disulfide-isomerase
MRPTWLAWALALATTTIAEPAPPGNRQDAAIAAEAVQGESKAGADEGIDYTVFNGVKVPPFKELTLENYDETIKDGYW